MSSCVQPGGYIPQLAYARSCASLSLLSATAYESPGSLYPPTIVMPAQEDHSEDHPDSVHACIKRVKILLEQSNTVDDMRLIDETIRAAKKAYVLSTEEGSHRLEACWLLASSLHRSYDHTTDVAIVEEVVKLDREALSLCPAGHLRRARCCDNLADSLDMLHKRTGDDRLMIEVVNLQREANNLCPRLHPDRARSCVNLASSLKKCFQRTGDARLVVEAMYLDREALDLCPEGHNRRATCCTHLAGSLSMRHQHTGHNHFIVEAVKLQCEALALRTRDHPDYAMCCGQLAISLRVCYELIGDDRLLIEVIDLEREALALCPPGHPDRARSCGRLAISLRSSYRRTGDVLLVHEAIELNREALDLCSERHPDRAWSCGHLAISLRVYYELSSDHDLLNEAIDLGREAINRCPGGHPDRAWSYGSLAISIKELFKQTGDLHLIIEVVYLDREALALCPAGNPNRARSCGNLADSLRMQYECTSDLYLLAEIFTLRQEALTIAPPHKRWRHLCGLSWLYLCSGSSFYDTNMAIRSLSQSLTHGFIDVPQAMPILMACLNAFWDHEADKKHDELVSVYHRVVNLLPLLANSALGMQSQLQALRKCTRIGSDAFVNAALAGAGMLGFVTMEFAQGMVWSQSLHRRDQPPEGSSELSAAELESLLNSIAKQSAPQSAETHHANIPEQEIRALSGLDLDHTMLGETYKTMCAAASAHPVVVLVGTRGHYYALIIATSQPQGHISLPLNLTGEEAQSLAFDYLSFHMSTRASKRTGRIVRLDRRLEILWHRVVKPVIDRLDLKVKYVNMILIELS
jgi:hypothetical protein